MLKKKTCKELFFRLLYKTQQSWLLGEEPGQLLGREPDREVFLPF